MAIDPKDAFTHLVYDYRYLAVAGCAWETVGPNGRQDDQKSANATIPGVGSIQKLGIRREVQVDNEQAIDIEIDMLRNGDSVFLHYNPMFLVRTGGTVKVTYELNSDLSKPITGSVPVKLWKSKKH